MEPSEPLEEWKSADLIQEYTMCRVQAALNRPTKEEDIWLRKVANELKSRGLLR